MPTNAPYQSVIDSPLGPLTAVANDSALVRLDYGSTDRANRPNRVIDLLSEELAAFFAGQRSRFHTPLDPLGTPFQSRVWEALRSIPCGETRSYAAIARVVGDPHATRAVGAANGANPISILVPCHRVVRTGGALGGYGGGLERKRWLLDHEAALAGRSLLPS